jgi:hypothetical protein
MEEVTVAVVNKVSPLYLEVMIPALLIAAVWVFSRVRRDKQGRFYWYRRSYEDRKCNGKLDSVLTTLDDMNRRTSRLELMDLISHCPHNRELIMSKYDDYHKHGWNSYIDEIVREWKAGLSKGSDDTSVK